MYIVDLYRMIMKERYLDVKHINFENYLNRIHTVVDYTYNNFQDKISLEQLAGITDVSVFRLSHFIKDALGIPYRDFLQNVRFEYALKLLKETDESIMDIARKCGFSDHKYLNKYMKNKFNTTPLKYRNTISESKVCTQATESTYGFIEQLKICLKKFEEDDKFDYLFGVNI